MKIFIKIVTFIYFFLTLSITAYGQDKIKIGLLVPITGQNQEIGKSIIKATRLAIQKINSENIEIIPKDTASNPETTFRNAKQLYEEGIRIFIGPVFNKNLIYLDKLEDAIFLSLTNKTIGNPKNIISAGINASSQIDTIKKFQKMNKINRTIFLVPNTEYKEEIEKAIKQTKINKKKVYYYETEPTKLTQQIEKITKYSIRKQNLKDEIKRIENSEELNKEKLLNRLNKLDTLGKLKFDSIVIASFDEVLKSITTSLLYTDVSPKKIYFITLNQWFDESLLSEISSQPMYFPSINKDNYDEFVKFYYKNFNEYPNQLSFLSYDLIGLIYYLSIQNKFIIDKKLFLKKDIFKGKVGIFEIKDNKISHVLNFYKIEDNKFKKIF
jgi:hypothetical protein